MTSQSQLRKDNSKTSTTVMKDWYPFIVKYDPIQAGSIDGTDTLPHDKGIIRALNSTYKPNTSLKSNPLHTIFVNKLNKNTKESDLREEFAQYGKVLNVKLVRDIITGYSKRYAFIEYSNELECAKAIEGMNGQTFQGCQINVDFECGRTLPQWKPRRLGGGFGGNKNSGQLRFGARNKPFIKPVQLMKQNELKQLREYSER